MENQKVLEILKTAILLERKGKAFYTAVSEKTENPDVRDFFRLMAKEEEEHIIFLSQQFSRYTKSNSFSEVRALTDDKDTSVKILSDKIKQHISSAGFEAAAISAAIDMETRAVRVYAERAELAEDPLEKEFYKWLSKWEQGHHKLLLDIDNTLKEKIWNDNQFWPF